MRINGEVQEASCYKTERIILDDDTVLDGQFMKASCKVSADNFKDLIESQEDERKVNQREIDAKRSSADERLNSDQYLHRYIFSPYE